MSSIVDETPLVPVIHKSEFDDAAAEFLDLCQYFGQKKLKDYAVFSSSSSSFCWGVM